ncbi:MAG TPA: LytTR family DNA-binding domain-containing protein [Gemmatimonadaceae bacterium]|jgi:two-component system LytT family response regulator|nr:LytTR family DNA-binding domain-containing protein [Gemmatimonadaceae bacterium]
MIAPPMTPVHRVLIVDDEPLARARLRELVSDDPALVLAGECANGRDAVTAIVRDDPDIVLLDVQMPELDGLGVVRAVGADRMPVTVFITASDAHAVSAFDLHAVDYVLKPVERDRFTEALRRAKRRVGQDAGGGGRTQLAALVTRLALKLEGRTLFIAPGTIDWVEALDNHVRLHTGRETLVVRDTLTHLAERLPPGLFLRVHRSTLVNTDRIREIQPWFGGEYAIVLTDGTKLTTGRRYRAAVQAFLSGSL